jgi:hypothetical protein
MSDNPTPTATDEPDRRVFPMSEDTHPRSPEFEGSAVTIVVDGEDVLGLVTAVYQPEPERAPDARRNVVAPDASHDAVPDDGRTVDITIESDDFEVLSV